MKLNVWISVAMVVISLLTMVGCLYYLNRSLSRVSKIIDSFLSKRSTQESDVAETRESKLISQLKRLIMISDYEIKSAKEEKEAVTRLISDLTHQLKTPLANITMYTELLQDQTLSEMEKQEFLLRTGEQAGKMEWLMQTLFKTSRLENGIIEFDIIPTYIKETIASGISAVYAQAESKNISIMIDEFTDQKLLHNPKWTSEIISNILENAIKYSPQSTMIKIKVERLELYSKIEISDRGIGIAPEEFNLIFRRFYRSKQVEQKEGSGLGLYLAQLIATKEAGYITVVSELGKGSTFSIYLQNA